MNEIGLSLMWCALQATLVITVGAALYAMVRSVAPAAAAAASLTGLLLIATLGVCALSPHPNWLAWLQNEWRQLEARNHWKRELYFDHSERWSADNAAVAEPAWQEPSSPASPDSAAAAPHVWRRMWIGVQESGYDRNSSHWQWPALVGVFFLLGAALGILRLAAGVAFLSCWRRIGRKVVDEKVLALFDDLRGQMNCRRKVRLRESASFAAPATVGWLRPMILLPARREEWTEAETRAVLAHEIAHIQRFDYVKWMAAQFSLALHFYHPLAHWLTHCLQVEHELAADAAAAKVSGGKRAYLAALAGLTLRQDSASRTGWLAQGFVPRRGALGRRIDSLRSSAPAAPMLVVWGAKALVVLLLLATSLAAAGLRQPPAAFEESPDIERVNSALDDAGEKMAALGKVGCLTAEGDNNDRRVRFEFALRCLNVGEAVKVSALLKEELQVQSDDREVDDLVALAELEGVGSKERLEIMAIANRLRKSAKVAFHDETVTCSMEAESRLTSPVAQEHWKWLQELAADFWRQTAENSLVRKESQTN